MRFSIFFLLFLKTICCIAQLERSVIKEPYKMLIRVDDKVLTELDRKKKRIFLNGKAIDSTGIQLYSFFGTKFMYQKGKIIFSVYDEAIDNAGKPANFIYAVNLNGRIETIGLLDKVATYVTSNNIFFKRKNLSCKNEEGEIKYYYGRNIYKLDITTGKPLAFYNLDKAAGIDSLDARNLYDLFELQNNKLIATISFCDGGCTDFRYFLIDIISRNINEINLNTKEPNNEYYRIEFLDKDKNHLLVEIDNYGIKKENAGFFIYDQNFKEITRVLERRIVDLGANYNGGSYLSDNVRAFLDDGQAVIIIYKFSMPLERSFYQIYNNLPLFPEDIKMCSAHELDLLRNMVFARHNYKFQSEFYQAYFNLYSFYSSEDRTKTRLKEITRLLTAVDKSNLSLIAKSSKK